MDSESIYDEIKSINDFSGESEPTTSPRPVTSTEPSTTENVKQTTEPPSLDASMASTIAITSSLVKETTGNISVLLVLDINKIVKTKPPVMSYNVCKF